MVRECVKDAGNYSKNIQEYSKKFKLKKKKKRIHKRIFDHDRTFEKKTDGDVIPCGVVPPRIFWNALEQMVLIYTRNAVAREERDSLIAMPCREALTALVCYGY